MNRSDEYARGIYWILKGIFFSFCLKVECCWWVAVSKVHDVNNIDSFFGEWGSLLSVEDLNCNCSDINYRFSVASLTLVCGSCGKIEIFIKKMWKKKDFPAILASQSNLKLFPL